MNPKSRHKARCYVLQALYQWHITHLAPLTVKQQFIENMENDNADNDYFTRLFDGATNHVAEIDKAIRPFLDRPLEALTFIELNTLRLATYELLACPDVPARAIINESLKISKTFGTTDQGFKYVNAVLDKVAHHLRQEEMQHD